MIISAKYQAWSDLNWTYQHLHTVSDRQYLWCLHNLASISNFEQEQTSRLKDLADIVRKKALNMWY